MIPPDSRKSQTWASVDEKERGKKNRSARRRGQRKGSSDMACPFKGQSGEKKNETTKKREKRPSIKRKKGLKTTQPNNKI